MNIPEHKAIIKRLIEEAEGELDIKPALPYTTNLLVAYEFLCKLEKERGRA
jgi:hypothetical protein